MHDHNTIFFFFFCLHLLLKRNVPFLCDGRLAPAGKTSAFRAHINDILGLGLLFTNIALFRLLDKHVGAGVAKDVSAVAHDGELGRIREGFQARRALGFLRLAFVLEFDVDQRLYAIAKGKKKTRINKGLSFSNVR